MKMGLIESGVVILIAVSLSVPEAPRAVKALVMGQDSILVSWRPPAQPNGVVTHYNVYTQAQNAEPHPNKVRIVLIFIHILSDRVYKTSPTYNWRSCLIMLHIS